MGTVLGTGNIPVKEQDEDGGYYAIKGFLYQFDTTIIEILNNPDTDVSFEDIQDINYEQFVVQVKHKETQSYTPGKIKTPIIQLLHLFKEDTNKNYRLYCYFKNISPTEKKLTLIELDGILGNKKNEFEKELKEKFIGSFILQFSENYEEQFHSTLEQIDKAYNLNNRDLSVLYHSIIRSEIFRLVIKEKRLRSINKTKLDEVIENYQEIVFYSAYEEHLSREAYEKMIRKEFFIQRKPNLGNTSRLFIIDSSKYSDYTDIHNLINIISRKYFRKDKSPAPIICFRDIEDSTLNFIKQGLLDRNYSFCDGTFFDGDKFRIEKLVDSYNSCSVRFVKEEYLETLLTHEYCQEIYQFFNHSRVEIQTRFKHIKIQINNLNQVIKIIS
ncbi:hypothetical protein BpOF4_09935 [Alkalihalophilus pseudofirmus OF4]|uniref:Uncharacterized protein n=1 Tax=Alkalihalophilus pseudofirmus (strain ATCC BAA-2126 / JCM 17055 / OF4) TaxID=398511 RepID=D3FTG9_ALKPO|nr:hypothetical protein [Alkalihalophilus pseudofirmus]ADC50042.1 hypothetical protein BpOF4_09935 [Alkalihalophilus pseudofirmus OF4]